MKINKIWIFLLFVIPFVLVMSACSNGCGKNNETTIHQKTEAVVESQPSQNWGPAGTTVQLFFKNWEAKDYEQMYSQVIYSNTKKVFVYSLNMTPIEWQNLVILSEKPSGNDWEVTLKVEVTDVVNAFASFVLEVESPLKPNQPRVLTVTPRILGINKFMPVAQTWDIVNKNGKYVIDIHSVVSQHKRHKNIMNYVLNTGCTDVVPEYINKYSRKGKLDRLAAWLWMAGEDLDLSQEELENIVHESAPLARKAEANLKKLVDELESVVGKPK